MRRKLRIRPSLHPRHIPHRRGDERMGGFPRAWLPTLWPVLANATESASFSVNFAGGGVVKGLLLDIIALIGNHMQTLLLRPTLALEISPDSLGLRALGTFHRGAQLPRWDTEFPAPEIEVARLVDIHMGWVLRTGVSEVVRQ
jgi:hypothetical protein